MGLGGLGLAPMPRRRQDGSVIDWAVPIRTAWDFSEGAALRMLDAFIAEGGALLGGWWVYRGALLESWKRRAPVWGVQHGGWMVVERGVPSATVKQATAEQDEGQQQQQRQQVYQQGKP